MAQNITNRGGGLFIRKTVDTFSTSTVIAQNGYLYKSMSFEGFKFSTARLNNGDSFIIYQSDDNGGPYTFTDPIASTTTIRSGVTNTYNTEISYIFKWDDELNKLTFIMKDS